MKKYLTVHNIIIGIILLAVLVLTCNLLTKSDKPKNNKSAIQILKDQIDSLKKANSDLQTHYETMKEASNINKREDSALLKQYEERIIRDNQTIQQLNKKRDEKKIVIDSASDSLLNRILSGLD